MMTPSARKRRRQLLKQMNAEVAHAGNRALGNHYIVQRLVLFVQSAAAHDLGVQHGTGIDVAAAVLPTLQRGVQISQANLGKEAQRAQVDAENGNIGPGEGTGRRQQRSIPAQHHHQLWLLCRQFMAGNDARILGVAPAHMVQNGFKVMRPHPGDELREQGGKLFLLRLGNDGDRSHGGF